jgi:hypothetical protein
LGLTALMGIQLLLLALFHATLLQVTAVFVLTGWLMATGGLLLYLLWLRPKLVENKPQIWPITQIER